MLEKKKPLRGETLRGGEALKLTETMGNCNIPATVLSKLEHEMQDVEFGGISLIITIRDGRPTFRIEKTLSFMAPSSGA